MKPYYADDLVTIFHADAREISVEEEVGVVVFDPPWDDEVARSASLPEAPSTLAFTDARYLGRTVERFGSPAWVFTWDTMSTWTLGARRPLVGSKHCLWFGDLDTYRRDAELWGDPPEAKNHPSTTSEPLSGRRLSDLYRESIRWLHHPSAGEGSTGSDRFSNRRGNPALRHAKPLDWVRCLIGNTSSGLVFDPFLGSGTSLVAARAIGRRGIGVDISEEACEYAARRLSEPTSPGECPGQLSLV